MRTLGEVRALLVQGDESRALVALEEHLDEHPDDAEARLLCGEIFERRRQVEDAIDQFELAVHHAPSTVAPRLALARVLSDAGRSEEAEEELRGARDIDRACPDPYFKLGNLLIRNGRHSDAITELRAGLQQAPHRADAWCNLAHALNQTGAYPDAEQACDRAIAIDLCMPQAHHNRAIALLAQGRADAALDSVKRALTLQDSALTHAVGGHALRDLGRIDEAVQAYNEALRRQPDLGDALINRCYANLLAGRYREAWPDYDRRFEATDTADRGYPYPAWKGDDPAGKTLFVYAEQGLGDEIMFASCIPDLIAAGARCVIECHERLAGLYARSFPAAYVHGGRKTDSRDWLTQAPSIDWQIAAGSLPWRLDRCESTFPAAAGYLRADPARRDRWRQKLSPDGRLTVGVSWRGGSTHTRGALRSMPFDALVGTFDGLDIRIINLQYGDLPESVRDSGLLVWPDLWNDLDEVAALMCELDVIVTVDNTVAHLAGALGMRGMVMLHSSPEWRYLQVGDRMPWYPSLTLLRQKTAGDWTPVLETLRCHLGEVHAASDGAV